MLELNKKFATIEKIFRMAHMYKKILLISALFISAHLSAEVQDKFKINLGGMLVTDFTTNVQWKRDNQILRDPIELDRDLGVDHETASFRLDGYYRFNDKHSIDFAYYGVRSNGTKRLERDIEWEDGTDIAVGADVNTYFNMDIYKLSYGYSFYHDDDLELLGSAGFHITEMDLGLNAVGTINDGEGREAFKSGESVTAPLPVFGFRGEYRLFDNALYATFKAEYLYIAYEDYTGDVISANIGLEYRFLENYGVGIGYSHNEINFKDESDDQQLKIKNTLSGAMAYLTYIY